MAVCHIVQRTAAQLFVQGCKRSAVHSHAIVRNSNEQAFFGAFHLNAHTPLAYFALNAVDNRIFNDRLQRQFGQLTAKQFRLVLFFHLDNQIEPVAKAVFLNEEIVFDIFKLILQRNKVLEVRDGIAEKGRECFGHIGNIFKPRAKGLAANTLKRVI